MSRLLICIYHVFRVTIPTTENGEVSTFLVQDGFVFDSGAGMKFDLSTICVVTFSLFAWSLFSLFAWSLFLLLAWSVFHFLRGQLFTICVVRGRSSDLAGTVGRQWKTICLWSEVLSHEKWLKQQYLDVIQCD